MRRCSLHSGGRQRGRLIKALNSERQPFWQSLTMRLSILYKLNLIDPRVRLPATQLTLSWQPQPRTVGCLIGAAETRKGVVTFSLTPQRYARIRADPRTELLLLQGQMNRVHAFIYLIYVCVCVIAKFCFYHTYICISIAAENVFLIKYIIIIFFFIRYPESTRC